MRLPNGYGSIIKTKGKRRKQWRVRVTAGWNDKGKQIYKNLGYYATRKEAMDALNLYHTNPHMISSDITFAELYEKFSRIKFKDIGDSSIKAYELSFKYFSDLHDMQFAEIRTDNLRESIDKIDKHGIKRKMKTLLNQLYDYAMENDIVDKDYSKFVKIGRNENKVLKSPFTQNEIDKLFKNVNNFDIVDSILIMIYSGFRIGELLDITKDDVNLEEHYIIGGKKTEAGKDRLVPISDKIWSMIENRYNNTDKYLFFQEEPNKQMNYRTYKDKFDLVMKNLGMKHTPHECRHTFATLLDNAGANERSITRIIGHNSFITTDKFYTHKDIDELRKAIDMI